MFREDCNSLYAVLFYGGDWSPYSNDYFLFVWYNGRSVLVDEDCDQEHVDGEVFDNRK